MANSHRFILAGAALGTLIGGLLLVPGIVSALADEPVKITQSAIRDLFPAPIDVSKFRKYDITLDDTVSTEIKRTRKVTKIGFGEKSVVTIVDTPSGVYSTDALASPHVLYPGIDKKLRALPWGDLPAEGTARWWSYSVGSIVYFTFSFEPGPQT